MTYYDVLRLWSCASGLVTSLKDCFSWSICDVYVDVMIWFTCWLSPSTTVASIYSGCDHKFTGAVLVLLFLWCLWMVWWCHSLMTQDESQYSYQFNVHHGSDATVDLLSASSSLLAANWAKTIRSTIVHVFTLLTFSHRPDSKTAMIR